MIKPKWSVWLVIESLCPLEHWYRNRIDREVPHNGVLGSYMQFSNVLTHQGKDHKIP
jgi:hypothetical protein